MAEEGKEEFSWKWLSDDPQKPVDLSENGLSVTFHSRKSSACTGVRGDKALHRNMEHWFHVRLYGPFHGQARMVGIGLKTTPLQSNSKDFYPLIGKDGGSWGLNYNGKTHHDCDIHDYTNIDHTRSLDSMIIGVYYNSYYGSLVFSIEDESLGLAFDNIPSTALELYPMICSSSRNSKMELLQCASSVCSLKSLCRGTVRLYMNKLSNIKKLPLPPHLIAYVNFQDYEHPKDYHSTLNLKTAANE